MASDGIETIGFCAAVPLSGEPEISELAKGSLQDTDNTWYFADLGVKREKRRLGIGTQLVTTMLNLLPAETVLMRTTSNNVASIGLNTGLGFEVIPGLTQEVPQLRKDGTTATDTRIFLLKEVNR